MEPNAPKTEEPKRSNMAAFVVVGALLGFGALLFLANFSGQVSDPLKPRPGGDPFASAKSKAKAKAAKGGKNSKVALAKLLIEGEPFERPAAPAGAKNVVFVIWTAVRRDHLTPYGADPSLTPFAQTLAADGVRMADVIAASPYSRTSAVAFLTGHHAATVDMVEPGPEGNERVLKAEIDTLAERVRAAGWGTYGVTGNFNLNANSGLAQGFDRYRDAQPNGFSPSVRLESGKVVENALEMLQKRSDEEKARPFYLQLDLIDAHQPLRVLGEDGERFAPEKPNAEYRSAVNRLDGALKALSDGLAAQGYDRNADTIFVLLSDHGEGNDEPKHHGKMHGRLLYDSSIVVPWIVSGGGLPKNRVVGGIVSHTDVMPTVLGLLDLPAPAGIDGQSWAAQIRGTGDTTTRVSAIADTWYFTANRCSIWTERMQCQKDFGTTGPADAFADGCFDRKTDPDFTSLLTDADLQGQLRAWRLEATRHVTEGAGGASGAEAAVDEGGQEPEDEGQEPG